MESAIVLSGGGIKSAVAAACVAKTYRVTFLHVNFGQRAAETEIDALRRFVDGVGGIKIVTVDLNYPLQIQQQLTGTAGLDHVMTGTEGMVGSTTLDAAGPSGTWPALVWAGAQAAIRVGARRVVSGLSKFEGAPHLGMPNGDQGFSGLATLAYDLNACIRHFTGEGRDVDLELPLLNRTYTEIIKLGVHVGVDLERTWTCVSPPSARGRRHGCQRCPNCRARSRAFTEARFTDPFELETARARN